MKQWNLKSFVAGIAITAIAFGLGVPAMAAAQTKTAELYYNSIKIRMNGKELAPKDASGNTVEPFVIDGTTYLPVRAVADALGLNVSWDGSTQTVILGNDTKMAQPAAWLGELETFTGSTEESVVTNQQYDNYSTANNGDTFDRVYQLRDYDGASYLLKGQYSRFTGTWYLNEDFKNISGEYRLLIYADDTLVYTSPSLTAGVEPIPFAVDVSNCYKLKIVEQGLGMSGDWENTGGSIAYAIGNAALWTD